MKKCIVRIETDEDTDTCYQVTSQVEGYPSIVEDAGIMDRETANNIAESTAKEIQLNNSDISVSFEVFL